MALTYRADIDGLRAFAIIPVVLFHAGVTSFSGGYVGVDIFFVISGYVIALSLLEDLRSGSFSIMKFYAKRIRRIFPALFFTIGVTSVFAWLFLLPSHLNAYFQSVVAAVMFVSNFYFWKKSGYFASDALTQPLLHTWSLSVEEQYYIFIPTLMFLVYKYLKMRWAYVFVPAIAFSLGLSIYATATAPTANFFLLPTRAWELLLGAFVATVNLPTIRWRALREIFGWLSLCLIIYPILAFNQSTPFPGADALYPCVGSAVILYLGVGSGSLANRFLCFRPFVWIGLISYSLYLVHWPIAAFTYYLTAAAPTLAVSGGIVCASLILAYFSWRFIESPFRVLSIRQFQTGFLWSGAAAILFFAAGGGLALQGDGFASRFPDFTERTISGHHLWRGGSCFLSDNPDPAAWKLENCTLTTGERRRVLLWGDSFAAQYVPGIVADKENLDATFIEYTAAGCPPILSYYSYARPSCTDFNQKALDIIRNDHIDVIILSARWTELKGRGLMPLAETIKALKKLNVDVFVIGQSPEFAADVQILAYHRLGEKADGSKAWALAFHPSINDELASNARQARFINPLSYLCQQDLCTYAIGNDYLFEDYGHLSESGSTKAVKLFFPFQKNLKEK